VTGARPRPPIERRTHIALCDLLRRCGRRAWWWSHIPSGELRTDETGALLKRMGMQAGMFDFLFIDPAGQHYWLELKRDQGARLTMGQVRFRVELQTRNVPHFVARSFDEAVRCLKAWGVLEGVHVQ
jgi:hypothetical protein